MALSHPHALWLFPIAVALLVFLQLFRSRRREVLAGSLMIWRRVAAKVQAPKRRRIVMDRTFWLQVISLGALAVALAAPAFIASTPPGRSLVLLLDNAPTARMRVDNKLLWERVVSVAEEQLDGLRPSDRVALITSSPGPRRMDDGRPLAPKEARDRLKAIRPALTHTETDEAWLFALEIARTLNTGDSTEAAAVVAVSNRPAPEDAETNAGAHWLAVDSEAQPANVGICELGSTTIFSADLKEAFAEVLVQVRNFSSKTVKGKVVLESLDSKRPLENARSLEIGSMEVKSVVFRLEADSSPPIRLIWKNDAGTDALPEDDTVTAAARKVMPPRLRVHGEAPHLLNLYRLGRGATIVEEASSGACDLEIFVEEVPETVQPSSEAALLLAPRQAFGPFDVDTEDLDRPIPRRGTEDRLIAGFKDRPEGLGFPIAKARTLSQTGDWRPVIQDSEGHVLAARFRLRDGRPAFVMGFVPGEGLGWAPKRTFGVVLGTLCLRVLREAQGAAEPYVVRRVAEIEGLKRRPLPLDWRPGLISEGASGSGVLSAKASEPETGEPSESTFSLSTFLPASQPVRHPLWPYLVVLAAALMLWEWAAERRPSMRRRGPGRTQTGAAPRPAL